MKIRISGNSIRFRLKQTEVKQFGEEGEIKEELSFGMLPADKLSFMLKAGNTSSFAISWESNQIMLQVPAALQAEWTNTDLVGFEKDIATGQGQLIRILVEKDFKCLDGSGVENEDTYSNPNQVC
ncbi:hypothetical protein QWZ08_11075 [Ferruginibacter paludis]|uniref:DUF7009 family protein n=1 Tax=Ferruginibacter paludis TaxID=1310417 RepID=UPI0025B59F94|nr:hypothetical protein [Ferruginibacter paludis]MDN3656172.1 hypothetical protein [Ferruginibacter paludis]